MLHLPPLPFAPALHLLPLPFAAALHLHQSMKSFHFSGGIWWRGSQIRWRRCQIRWRHGGLLVGEIFRQQGVDRPPPSSFLSEMQWRVHAVAELGRSRDRRHRAVDEDPVGATPAWRIILLPRMWRGLFGGREDYEKRLQYLSKEEASVHVRMRRRTQFSRRTVRNIIVLSVLAEPVILEYLASKPISMYLVVVSPDVGGVVSHVHLPRNWKV